MTKQQLEAIIKSHGCKIDGYHQGAGKFRDLEIGIGSDLDALVELRDEIKVHHPDVSITRVDNASHPQFGQSFVWVQSFWWE